MNPFIVVLKRTKLFAGVAEQEIEAMLSCLGAKRKEYKKGEYVFRQGEYLEYITVLVEGGLHIQQDDYWGNRSIVSPIVVGEMFGEAYIAPESGPLLNDVVAMEDSVVILLNAKRIMLTCSSACRFHSMVIQNLFFAISERNRNLVQKLGHLSKRSTREKLISYPRPLTGWVPSLFMLIPTIKYLYFSEMQPAVDKNPAYSLQNTQGSLAAFTYQLPGSYSRHSSDSASPAGVGQLLQIAGNGRFPVPAGT